MPSKHARVSSLFSQVLLIRMQGAKFWHVNLSEFAGIESLLLPCQALLTKWNESRRQGNERTS